MKILGLSTGAIILLLIPGALMAETADRVNNHFKELNLKIKPIIESKKEEEYRSQSQSHLEAAMRQVRTATPEKYPAAQRNLLDTLKRVSVMALVDHEALVKVLEKSPEAGIRSEAHRLQLLIAAAKHGWGGLGVKDPNPLPSMESILAFSRLVDEAQQARKACYENPPTFRDIDKKIKAHESSWAEYQRKIDGMLGTHKKVEAVLADYQRATQQAADKLKKAQQTFETMVEDKKSSYPKLGQPDRSEFNAAILAQAKKIRPLIEEIFVFDEKDSDVDDQAQSIAEKFVMWNPFDYYQEGLKKRKIAKFADFATNKEFLERLGEKEADWPDGFKKLKYGNEFPQLETLLGGFRKLNWYTYSPGLDIEGVNVSKLTKLDKLNESLKDSAIRKEMVKRIKARDAVTDARAELKKTQEARRKFLRSQNLPEIPPAQLEDMKKLALQNVAKLAEVRKSLTQCQAKLKANDERALRVHADVGATSTEALKSVKIGYTEVLKEKNATHKSVGGRPSIPGLGSSLP